MQHSFSHHRPSHPHRPPYRRPGGSGLVNLLAAVALGVLVYRKGVEEGAKLAEKFRKGQETNTKPEA